MPVRLRAFWRMSRRVTEAGKVKHFRCGAGGKPSPNRALESVFVDPKPGDLPMARVKWG